MTSIDHSLHWQPIFLLLHMLGALFYKTASLFLRIIYIYCKFSTLPFRNRILTVPSLSRATNYGAAHYAKTYIKGHVTQFWSEHIWLVGPGPLWLADGIFLWLVNTEPSSEIWLVINGAIWLVNFLLPSVWWTNIHTSRQMMTKIKEFSIHSYCHVVQWLSTLKYTLLAIWILNYLSHKQCNSLYFP